MKPGDSRRVLVVGASVRSAAQSLGRAGAEPIAVDLFGDRDLAQFCPTFRIADYDENFIERVEMLRPDAWLYTGGLENYPDVIERLTRSWPLAGVCGQSLTNVRDPFQFLRSLREAGFATPDIVSAACVAESGLPDERCWLVKPLRSCGGREISVASKHLATTLNSDEFQQSFYFQRFISGPCKSALFVGTDRGAELIGVCEQHRIDGSVDTSSFQFAGAIGPVPVGEQQHEELGRLGELLLSQFRLRGLFGVDFIDVGGNVWPLEVNPRYTATVELYERSIGRWLMRDHLLAFSVSVGANRHGEMKPSREIVGKQIVYSDRDLEISEEFSDTMIANNLGMAWPSVADIPEPGTAISVGEPVVTVFASGTDVETVRRELSDSSAGVMSMISH